MAFGLSLTIMLFAMRIISLLAAFPDTIINASYMFALAAGLVVASALYTLHAPHAPRLSGLAFALMTLGEITAAVVQFQFAFGGYGADKSALISNAGVAALGVGLLFFAALSRRHRTPTSIASSLMIAFGMVSLFLIVERLASGQSSPLSTVLNILSSILYVAWNMSVAGALLGIGRGAGSAPSGTGQSAEGLPLT
jgi:hypothetical protein